MDDIISAEGGLLFERLPVMPLPLVILPGGIQRLKIFEPRYLSMIKRAIKEEGFVVSLLKPDSAYATSSWGVWVKIIDFNLGSGNILLIDIQALTMVEITSVERDSSGVLIAELTHREHWGFRDIDASTTALVENLRDIFKQHISLRKLYKKTHFYDANWVCARYIEVLPLSLNEKEKFIFDYSFDQIENFLHTLIQGPIRNN
jgi:Lon protease-like protein